MRGNANQGIDRSLYVASPERDVDENIGFGSYPSLLVLLNLKAGRLQGVKIGAQPVGGVRIEEPDVLVRGFAGIAPQQ
jgi:hypothetical protein